MASRTVYTSTISVPVYASWKCEECGEVNFATGVITCRRQSSTGSWRSSKQAEAKESAAAQARADWTGEAFKIISDPNQNGAAMYSNFRLKNTKCTKCQKKARWNKKENLFNSLAALCLPVALISGIAAFNASAGVTTWLVFLASVGIIAWGSFLRKEVYKRMMSKFPKEYTPVIGSLNKELIAYAGSLKKTIPNPGECIATVKGYDQVANTSVLNVQPVVESADSENTTTVQSRFCCECGAQLQAEDVFCHECGTKSIKQ